MYLPSSTAFFQGQTDAANGLAAPRQPSSHASYDEKMYFRGFMQQQRKMTKMAEAQSYRMDVFALAS
ncbi:MAG TPA: hypothetical protein PK002_03105 [Cellvibrio sp.]|nr:hypothetical protein [Cellvibrio sp.]